MENPQDEVSTIFIIYCLNSPLIKEKDIIEAMLLARELATKWHPGVVFFAREEYYISPRGHVVSAMMLYYETPEGVRMDSCVFIQEEVVTD